MQMYFDLSKTTSRKLNFTKKSLDVVTLYIKS